MLKMQHTLVGKINAVTILAWLLILLYGHVFLLSQCLGFLQLENIRVEQVLKDNSKNNLPLQESLTVNTSAPGLKTLSQQPASINSPPKAKVNNPSKKKPDKRPMNGNMAETAGAAGGIKAVQADVNANTLAPVTSSGGTANDCYEFRDSPVQPVCALPPMLHPIPRGIPSAGIPDSAKMGDSEKENSQSSSATCTSTPPSGPTLITFPVMQKLSQIPSESQPAFPSPTPESKDSASDVKSENLAMSNGDVPKPENCSPEVKSSLFMSPGKIGLVDSRDSKENQSKVFAPITWPPVVFGNAPVQGQPSRSQKTSSPKSSPPASSSTASSSVSTVAASSSPSKPSPSSSLTTAAAVTSPSVAKPMPTVVGIPAPSGIPSAVPGVPPVTISAAAVPAGYHEYMAMMMARYSTAAQNARTDEANYMAMVRKYYADWYEMYSRYPYAALSAGAAYPSSAASGDSMKAAIPGMIPFPGYMYPMATTDPRLIDLSNRAAVAAAATATAKEAESRLNLSPPSGVKRSISETSPGHDVLDLSVKKPRVESPVASRPSTVIPSHPNPLTHPIPGLIPPVGIPGHPIPVCSVGGLTIPIAGLPTPTVQSLAAAGDPANMLDPRALALATGNGTSVTLSLAHAQQQALTLSSVGYPMAAAYMPHGMTFPQLCSASTTDRDKLLKAQHVPFAGDIRM